jgi:hypothetical protein
LRYEQDDTSQYIRIGIVIYLETSLNICRSTSWGISPAVVIVVTENKENWNEEEKQKPKYKLIKDYGSWRMIRSRFS